MLVRAPRLRTFLLSSADLGRGDRGCYWRESTFGCLVEQSKEGIAGGARDIGLAALVVSRTGLAEIIKDQAALLQRAHCAPAPIRDQLRQFPLPP